MTQTFDATAELAADQLVRLTAVDGAWSWDDAARGTLPSLCHS